MTPVSGRGYGRAGALLGVASVLGLVGMVPARAHQTVTAPAPAPDVTAPASAAPRVTVSPVAAAPGQLVVVTIEGWPRVAVTVALCGNEAARGTGDCDLAGARGLTGGPRPDAAQVAVALPPAPCPCVVRASTPTSDTVALAPFEVVGAPVAEVVRPVVVTPVVVPPEPAPADEIPYWILVAAVALVLLSVAVTVRRRRRRRVTTAVADVVRVPPTLGEPTTVDGIANAG